MELAWFHLLIFYCIWEFYSSTHCSAIRIASYSHTTGFSADYSKCLLPLLAIYVLISDIWSSNFTLPIWILMIFYSDIGGYTTCSFFLCCCCNSNAAALPEADILYASWGCSLYSPFGSLFMLLFFTYIQNVVFLLFVCSFVMLLWVICTITSLYMGTFICFNKALASLKKFKKKKKEINVIVMQYDFERMNPTDYV